MPPHMLKEHRAININLPCPILVVKIEGQIGCMQRMNMSTDYNDKDYLGERCS